MDKMSPSLKRELKFYKNQISDFPSDKTYVTTHAVIDAHFILHDYFVGKELGGSLFGIKDGNMIHSAVLRQFSEFGGVKKYNTEYEKFATLYYGLNKDHAFVDGNKRTALLILLLCLDKINKTLELSNKEVEVLAVRTASGELNLYDQYPDDKPSPDADVEFLAYYIHKFARTIDKKEYIISYRKLEKALISFDIYFDKPKKGKISVRKVVIEGIIFGKKVNKLITKVIFKGWDKDVPKDVIKQIRKKCKLRPEDGIDSKILYRKASVVDIIAKYRVPLRRLRDR
ncbi:MAG: Fic family protein [Bacteriovoracaceae bacterium]|nr:Fic family protein [Bacteriovoracaceae bacterium]